MGTFRGSNSTIFTDTSLLNGGQLLKKKKTASRGVNFFLPNTVKEDPLFKCLSCQGTQQEVRNEKLSSFEKTNMVVNPYTFNPIALRMTKTP